MSVGARIDPFSFLVYVPCECPECDVRHNGRAVADESSQGGRAGLIRPARRRAGKEWRAGGRQALDGSECLCRSVSALFVVLCKKLFCE